MHARISAKSDDFPPKIKYKMALKRSSNQTDSAAQQIHSKMRGLTIALCCLLALATCRSVPVLDYYAYPKYAVQYSVNDPHTGDVKGQWEKRDGDAVIGEYHLNEPDGTIRVVKYRADDHTGFKAKVERIGHAVHPSPIKVWNPIPIRSIRLQPILKQPLWTVPVIKNAWSTNNANLNNNHI